MSEKTLTGFDPANPTSTKGVDLSRFDCQFGDSPITIVVNWGADEVIITSSMLGKLVYKLDDYTNTDGVNFKQWITNKIIRALYIIEQADEDWEPIEISDGVVTFKSRQQIEGHYRKRCIVATSINDGYRELTPPTELDLKHIDLTQTEIEIKF